MVVMPMTRSLMPDLMVSALGLYALSIYLSRDLKDRWSIVGGGVLLGLAMWTKYPAILLLFVPLILERNAHKLAYFVLPAINVFLLGEMWLFFQYDQWHLLTVLSESDVVGRGALGHRAFGIPIRLGLSALPMALVGVRRHPFFPLGVIAVGIYLLDWKLGLCLALGLSTLGLMWKGDRWMSVWIGLVLLGVVVGHNYAAPRYWLVAMVPLAILACRHLQQWSLGHRWGLLGVSFLWATGMLFTERHHAEQSVKLAMTALSKLPADLNKDSLAFSGEWTFRSQMLDVGIVPFDGTQSLVLTAVNAAGWTPHVEEGWQLLESWEAAGSYMRLSSSADSVGWYADTLGAYPVWMSGAAEPIERVELWKKQ